MWPPPRAAGCRDPRRRPERALRRAAAGGIVRPRAAVLVLLFFFLLPALAAALDVPALEGRVNDHANLLPPDARQRIEQKLAGLEQRTGAQVAVLTIPSL